MQAIKIKTMIAVLLAAVLVLPAGIIGQAADRHWVGAWGASPHAAIHMPGTPAVADYENQTIRMVVRPSIGGEQLRIRFSNAFGAKALKIGAAHVALIEQGSKIVADSDRVLTFGGLKTIAVPPGAPALSDPVDLKIPAFAELAVSIFLPEKTKPNTTHLLGQHETYIGGPGDLTAAAEIANAATSHSWYWLSGVEIWVPKNTASIITLGDSITDGFGVKAGEYLDWPDQLAKRLAVGTDTTNLAVVNEGIGGNRILHDGMGVSTLARFDRDVLATPGVRTLLFLEGVNDLGWPHMKPPKGMDLSKIKMPDFAAEDVVAADLIYGMMQIIDRAHEHGIKIVGATILPYEGSDYFSDKGEATRQVVNQWIRTGSTFDGVVDFDAVVRDPAHPTRFRNGLQSGDFLHPNAAGYKAMADAIDLLLLKPAE
jgi:lysophospholipase L1-like esterase